jgi:hypothetical protein
MNFGTIDHTASIELNFGKEKVDIKENWVIFKR